MKIIAVVLIFHCIFIRDNNSNSVQKFNKESQQFAANVYKELIKIEVGNFIVCPLSVQIVLALTSVGAKGKTREELTTTLRIPQTVEEIEETFGEITPRLNQTGNYTLVGANKIYVKNNLELNPNYINSATRYFQSEIESVNFLAEETIPKINSWVSKSTFEKITDLIPPGSFNDLTQLVLINTLYFRGTWDKIFNKNYTTKKPFFISESLKKETDMMQMTNTLKYAHSEKLKAHFVELFYKDSDISMIIAVPTDINGTELFEGNIEEVLEPQAYNTRRVHLQMPKFTTVSNIKFKNILMNMGIKNAFGELADFSGMLANGGRSLRIDDVLQKALIEVDEEGTTAAAATAVIVGTTSVQITVDVIANRPFIYYLKSKSVGVLFIGKYTNPEDTVN